MPFYEYECSIHGRFLVRQPMFAERKATCECGEEAIHRISTCNFRIAEPLTVYQELPGNKGYQEIGWTADGGISPPKGQPMKTAKEVAMDEIGGGIKEV